MSKRRTCPECLEALTDCVCTEDYTYPDAEWDCHHGCNGNPCLTEDCEYACHAADYSSDTDDQDEPDYGQPWWTEDDQ